MNASSSGSPPFSESHGEVLSRTVAESHCKRGWARSRLGGSPVPTESSIWEVKRDDCACQTEVVVVAVSQATSGIEYNVTGEARCILPSVCM